MISRAILGVLLCALLALLAPLPASATTTCPGRNGQIAVLVSENGPATVGLVGQGGQVDPLFETPASYGAPSIGSPSFSCDGSQIIFSYHYIEEGCGFLEAVSVPSAKKLHWAGVEGTKFPAQPPSPPYICPAAPSYLADGQIIFTGSGESGTGTYIAGPRGGDPQRLFTREVWASSANGQWFVGAGPTGDHVHLWLLNQKGNPVNRITAAPAGRGNQYSYPSFSPDGRWITYCKGHSAFYIHSAEYPEGHKFRQRFDLYLVRRDGTHERRLTHDGLSCDPSFSPDGRQIAFVYGEGEEESNVAVISLKRPSKVRLLTHVGPQVRVRAPTWAPR